MERKTSGDTHSEANTVHDLTRHIVNNLEAKWTVRTLVEGLNLSMRATDPDALAAECWRTVHTIMCLAQTLLHREDVEAQRIIGRSIIAAIHDHKTKSKCTYVDAPADLMCGFRGSHHNVDLMPPIIYIH